jgi:hypothetical protein
LIEPKVRFVTLGLQTTGTPIRGHISARAEDLDDLMAGLTVFDRGAARALDPVLAAAVLAFGFVYIHPFEDGNGRLHRFLIHHVLAERGFNPPHVVFPVSAVILDHIDEYRQTLESYSQRLLPYIRWQPTERGNVEVLNDTADFYRFFDATPHAEFLFTCVARTVDVDLPAETAFLASYDTFKKKISVLVDMPERLMDLLFRSLHQNDGVLSRRGRDREFAALTNEEIERIQAIYDQVRPRLKSYRQVVPNDN